MMNHEIAFGGARRAGPQRGTCSPSGCGDNRAVSLSRHHGHAFAMAAPSTDMTRLPKDGGSLHPHLAIGAVLVAAGAGSRLGGCPKPLLELNGVSLIRRQLMALSGAGVDEVVVVLGHHAAAIEAAVAEAVVAESAAAEAVVAESATATSVSAASLVEFPVTLAHNPAPDDGLASSVLTGLRALAATLDAVIVALADQPLIEREDIVALIGAYQTRGRADMLVPCVAGEPGNPVMLSAALRAEWLAGDTDAAGRRWRDANPDRVAWFDTGNDHYRFDIDTPEDLERFQARTGHALRWPVGLE